MRSLKLFALFALAACGGKVAFDGLPSGTTGGHGGSTSSVTTTTTTTTATTMMSSSFSSGDVGVGPSVGVSTSVSTSSGSPPDCVSGPSCNGTCCNVNFPGEYIAFQKDLLLECGCGNPNAPCLAECNAGGSCVDPATAADPSSACHQCLSKELSKGAMSPCLIKTITGDCTNDCAKFAACIIMCNT